MSTKAYLDIDELNKISDIGAWSALKKARMYGTKLSVYEDGLIKHETPDEFEKNLLKELAEEGLEPSKKIT
jgi:hypothetical protein